MSDDERHPSSDPPEPQAASRAKLVAGLIVVTVIVVAVAVLWMLGSGDTIITVSVNLLMFSLIGGAIALPVLLLARYTRPDEPHGARPLGFFVEGLRGERKDRDGPRPGD